MSQSNSHSPSDEKVADILQYLCEQHDFDPNDRHRLKEHLDGLTDQELTDLLGAGQCLELLQELGRLQYAEQESTGGNQSVSPRREPETIGPYQIIELAAQGGFARIYRAVDPRLERMVALKVPLFERLVEPSALQRFEREARAVATLTHPAIVPVFDVSTDDVPYIALQWIPGKNLHEWLRERRKPVPIQEAAAAVHRVAEAVAHAHAKGILHRDLKPANLLIEMEPGGATAWYERLRVTDFGLSKALSETTEKVTIDGTILGTPEYMSPEQISSPGDVGPATDVYSLGVVLYELLTGQVPHRKTSYAATLRSVEKEFPKPVRALRRDVPSELMAICQKCIEKSPSDRYPDATSLAADLDRFLRGLPVEASRPTLLGRTMKWARRNPAIAASWTAVFLSLTSGLAISMSLNHSLKKSNDEFVQQTKILQSIFDDLDRGREGARMEEPELRERLAKRINQAAQLVERQEDAGVKVSLLTTMGKTLATMGYPDQSVRLVRRAIEIAERELSMDEDGRHRLTIALARGLLAQDRFDEVIETLAPSIDSILDSTGIDAPTRMSALVLLGEAYFQQPNPGRDQLNQTIATYQRLLQVMDQYAIDDVLEQRYRTLAHFRIAMAQFRLKPSTDSLREVRAKYEQFVDCYGEDHYWSIYGGASMVQGLSQLGQWNAATELASHLVEVVDRHFGEADYTTLLALDASLVAHAKKYLNDPDPRTRDVLLELLPRAEHNCRIVAEKMRAGHPSVLAIYQNIATAWGAIGEHQRSFETLQSLLATVEQVAGRDSDRAQNTIYTMGLVLVLAGRPEEARPYLQEFVDHYQNGTPMDPTKLIIARQQLAALGDPPVDSPESQSQDEPEPN